MALRYLTPLIAVVWLCCGAHVAVGSWQVDVSSGFRAPPKQTVIKNSRPVYSLAVSPDGKMLVAHLRGIKTKTRRGSTYLGGSVKVWSLPHPRLVKTLGSSSMQPSEKSRVRLMYYSSAFAITPDSKMIVLGGGPESTGLERRWKIPVLSLPGGEFVKALERGAVASDETSSALAITPNGELVAGGFSDNAIELWSLTSGQHLATLNGHSSAVEALIISADGRVLVSASNDKTIKLWSLPDGRLITTLVGHTDGVNALALRVDGKILASGSDDKTINLWELREGRIAATLRGHTEELSCMAISPDGLLLASGAYDKTVKLWSLPEGRLLATLRGHTDMVNALTITPDGKFLISGGQEGAIILWALK